MDTPSANEPSAERLPAPALPPGLRWLRKVRSIRSKLAVGFGALVALITLNTALYFWGATQRADAFAALQTAIERQVLLTDAYDRVEDQQTYFDLLAVLGSEAQSASAPAERRLFTARIDTTTAMVQAVLDRTEADRRPVAESLYVRTARLGEAWKSFFALQGGTPEQALEVLYVQAEPVVQQLLNVDFPMAAQAEEERLESLSEEFVETSRLFGRLTWIGLAVSALLGGLLAFAISRDLLSAIEALQGGAEALGAGRRGHRIGLDRQDELGDVAMAFDTMAARLAEQTEQVEAQRDTLTATLTELRTTQAQLVQREKLASLGELTAGIAHEIKNPLNFVNNFAVLSGELVGEVREIVSAPGRSPDEIRSGVGGLLDDLEANSAKIEEHGRRADNIVRSMLEHSRQRSGEAVPTDVNALVEEYASLALRGMQAQHPEAEVDMVTDYAPDVGAVNLAPGEIGRVVVNLVNNALYAVSTYAGTAAPEAYTPAVRVETRRAGSFVTIRVSDNGPGLAPETAAKVFEPFFTTKPTGEGTGLGLSLSYEIVTRGHKGTLRLVPSETGATFEVRLPTA